MKNYLFYVLAYDMVWIKRPRTYVIFFSFKSRIDKLYKKHDALL